MSLPPLTRRPLVSVITPTWQRPDVLLRRCLPSVQAQSYPNIEHIIVSDGPDEELPRALAGHSASGFTTDTSLGVPVMILTGWRFPVGYTELAEHDARVRWGVRARLAAIGLARGELIAYLDDDNSWRPDHVARLVDALEADPVAGFAYSITLVGGHSRAGSCPPVLGGIDTSAIMHRREPLNVATWRDNGQQTIDWDLVERWMQAGVGFAFVPHETVDYFQKHQELPPAAPWVREADVTWQFTAAGHCNSEEDERALAEELGKVLDDAKYNTAASQFGGLHVNGPVHGQQPARRTVRGSKAASGKGDDGSDASAE